MNTDDLLCKIADRLNASLNLSGNVYFDKAPAKESKPKASKPAKPLCVIALVNDSVQGTFGNALVDTVTVSLSFYSLNLKNANDLAAGAWASFKSNALSLAQDSNLAVYRREQSCRVDSRNSTQYVYESRLVLAFVVQEG